MSAEKVTLEKIPWFMQQRISQHNLLPSDNYRVVHFIDQSINAMVYELQAFVAGRTNQKVEFKYPADWWQATKEHFAPKWFIRRYPVKYTEVVIEAREFYPSVKLPEYTNFVEVVRVNPLQEVTY